MFCFLWCCRWYILGKAIYYRGKPYFKRSDVDKKGVQLFLNRVRCIMVLLKVEPMWKKIHVNTMYLLMCFLSTCYILFVSYLHR